MIYTFIAGVLLFIGYMTFAIVKFGVPSSLSDTFYLYGGSPKGYVFTACMWAVTFLIMPLWFSVTSEWFAFSTFLACGGLMLVGAAPLFKTTDAKWHTVFAIICAVFALLWQILSKEYWECAAWLMIALAVSIPTKTFSQCKTFYLEMVAFYSTFTSVLVKVCSNAN